jgi:hypothetical protein
MSNLKAARQAIQSELAHARKGAAFYQARVKALEDALAKLAGVDTTPDGHSSKRKGRNEITRGKPSKRAEQPGTVQRNKRDLPSTGKDFWPSLITVEPRSAPEILNAAVKALGISPSREQLKKLAQRQTNALHNLVKRAAIADSGAGRNRRFFIAR